MVFPVVMCGCESWAVKKGEHQQIDALNYAVEEDASESLGLQGDPPVQSKGDQSQVFIGSTNVEAETPILWPPHAKS